MRIFNHCFETLTEDDIKLLKEYFKGYDYQGSSYTFLTSYIWRETYCLCWEKIGDYVFLAGVDCMLTDGNPVIAMPLTRDGKYDTKLLGEAIIEAKRRFSQRKKPLIIANINEDMKKILEEALPGQLVFEHDRDDDDYVYNKEKLIKLSGRALHKKKNHMNFFLKNYQFESRPLDKSMAAEILALVDQVAGNKADSYTQDELTSLEMEKCAIEEMIGCLDDENVHSVGIFIDGQMEGFAIGELLSSHVAVEHFEKANGQFRGLYQVVCSQFCQMLPEQVTHVNREEDMGLETLRQAKEALRPEYMVEKWTARFKDN